MITHVTYVNKCREVLMSLSNTKETTNKSLLRYSCGFFALLTSMHFKVGCKTFKDIISMTFSTSLAARSWLQVLLNLNSNQVQNYVKALFLYSHIYEFKPHYIVII